ncbi:MAG: hypothetical protein LBK99_20670 [Opitutaceae bacterium]|jgi:hypothetical protein|nr:hypothetical protein [Opitutaceae bacterium]
MKDHTGIIKNHLQHTRRGGSLRQAMFTVSALAALAFPATQAKALITVSDVVIGEQSFSFRFTGSFPEWPANGTQPHALLVYASSDDILLKPFIDFCTENPQSADWFSSDTSITGTIAEIPFNSQETTRDMIGSGYTDLSSTMSWGFATGFILGTGANISSDTVLDNWNDYVGEVVDLTFTLDWSSVEALLDVTIFDTKWTGTLTFGWGFNESLGDFPFYPENNAVILWPHSAVPEPAGYATLAGLALLAWAAVRRYRGARG